MERIPSSRPRRARGSALLCATLFAAASFALIGAFAAPAGATTRSSLPAQEVAPPRIIPQPNSGREPRDYGDRGGVGQTVVFFGICGAILALGGLAALDGRRKRARRAAARSSDG